ncbi:MAG: hypothetical protein HY707_13995 [Ignavibacteriae bacterium]|nr:hypothetical protein [Ignavibacteriota bacterium]
MKNKQRGNRSLKGTARKKVGVKSIRFRQSLFWDVDPKTIDVKHHARYIIERILDFGSDDEIQWVWKTYNRSLIRKVVTTSRVLHHQTRSLWLLLTDPKQ